MDLDSGPVLGTGTAQVYKIQPLCSHRVLELNFDKTTLAWSYMTNANWVHTAVQVAEQE